jgi:methyl-accepting chemotaxis protein
MSTKVATRGETSRASWFANLSTMTKVMVGVLPPLILLVAIGAVSVYNTNKLVERSGWVDHTRIVLAEAEGILAAAVDMETGMRGFLLAGEDSFLAPYEAGEKRVYAKIEALQQTVSDNPPQVERLAEAEAVLREWQGDVTEMQIALRREIGDAPSMNDIAEIVGEARGKTYFDKFRGKIGAFIDNERTLLDQRRATFEAELRTGTTNTAKTREALAWVTHTYEVIDTANAIIAAAVDMETGMRGYLLAGDTVFLEPYDWGKERFHTLLDELQNTISDNPPQVALLGEVRETIQGWENAVVEPMIALRASIAGARNMDDMRDIVGEARGKQYFDRFREILAAFSAEEAKLIAQRQAANEATVAQTFTLIVGGVVLAAMLGLIAAWMIGRGIAGPIRAITQAMRALAGGDTGVAITGQNRRDEVGDMARATDVFKQNAIEKARLDAEAAKAAEAERAAARERAAIQTDVAGVVEKAGEGDSPAASATATPTRRSTPSPGWSTAWSRTCRPACRRRCMLWAPWPRATWTQRCAASSAGPSPSCRPTSTAPSPSCGRPASRSCRPRATCAKPRARSLRAPPTCPRAPRTRRRASRRSRRPWRRCRPR